MPSSGYSLTVTFRQSGWQWPLSEGDTVRVWAPGGHLVAEIPGPFVREILGHYLQAAALQGKMAAHVKERPMLPADPPPVPPRLRDVNGRKLRRAP